MEINDILQENCNEMIPTKWNIYEWAEAHPDTTIAHALKRVEKNFDFSDFIYCGYSGGKDSTVSANLSLLELNLRKLRVKNGVDRDGNHRIDPLDAKWVDKRISFAMTDAEVCFTDTNDNAKRFIELYGPRGKDLIEFNWICFPLAWQSGVSFDSGILISWDKDKENIWVQPMPTRDDLYGFDPITEDNMDRANPVLLSSLSNEAQEYFRNTNQVVQVKKSELVEWQKEDSNELVDAVGNFGRGIFMYSIKINSTTFKKGMHEKEEQDAYSYWIYSTQWLLDN